MSIFNSPESNSDVLPNAVNNKTYILVIFMACIAVLLSQYFLSASGVAGNYISSLQYFNELSNSFSYVIGWGIFTVGIYSLIPLFAIYLLNEKPIQFGFAFTRGGKAIYLLAPFVLLPITFFFSKSPSFQNTYPYLSNPESIEQLIIWEIAYGLQFLALEFFFRGFLLHAILKYVKPMPAIILASIPYTMIHLVKPTPEAVASFFGGAFLCWLAIKYKSISIGFYLHITLAVSMDIFVLYHKGWFNSV